MSGGGYLQESPVITELISAGMATVALAVAISAATLSWKQWQLNKAKAQVDLERGEGREGFALAQLAPSQLGLSQLGDPLTVVDRHAGVVQPGLRESVHQQSALANEAEADQDSIAEEHSAYASTASFHTAESRV
ncbi:hypothetical protein EG329_006424 [Mollisiaceae sp. DMI_Dod_QoI]|nr:hypothetical protein EG329_006424 [Helotiales sp. DMI_Dod_QoI]